MHVVDLFICVKYRSKIKAYLLSFCVIFHAQVNLYLPGTPPAVLSMIIAKSLTPADCHCLLTAYAATENSSTAFRRIAIW